MAFRGTLAAAAVLFGLAAEASAGDFHNWCVPGTTKIYGCYDYQLSSRCCNRRPQYSFYDVGVPALPCNGWESYSWTRIETGSRTSSFNRWPTYR